MYSAPVGMDFRGRDNRPPQFAPIAATVHAQQLRPQATAAATTVCAFPSLLRHSIRIYRLSSRELYISSQGTEEEEEAKANAKAGLLLHPVGIVRCWMN